MNIGNLFVAAGNSATGASEVIGLDMFDPASPFRNAKESVSVQEGRASERWPGRLLADNAARVRAELAVDVVDDLELVLGPRNRKVFWGRRARLPKNAAARFERGLAEGAATLKRKLAHGGQASRRASPAMCEKLRMLGWIR